MGQFALFGVTELAGILLELELESYIITLDFFKIYFCAGYFVAFTEVLTIYQIYYTLTFERKKKAMLP
jgi:hypothetical protein